MKSSETNTIGPNDDFGRHPHVVYFDFVRQAINTLALAFSPIVIAVVLLSFAPAPVVSLLGTFALLFGIVVFVIAFRLIGNIHQRVEDAYDEWRLNEENHRECALARASVDITVIGNKNKVNVTQPTQNNILIEDNKSQTRAEFMNHFAEFLREAERQRTVGDGETGFERRLYLLSDGASKDYTFDCDGKLISRPEYEQLVQHAKEVKVAPEGRRKGTRGKALSEKYTPIE